jgi:fructokinase
MKSLLAFGEVLVDLIEDPEQPGVYRRLAGGAPANVAVGFARLGGRAALMGGLSNDTFGQFLRAELERFGVDTSALILDANAPTALALVSLDAARERSFQFHRQASADVRFGKSAIDETAFATHGAFHFCSNTLTHEAIAEATHHAIELAHKHGMLISFDVNLRPGLWPAGRDALPPTRELTGQAHLLKASREEWEALAAGNERAFAAQCFARHTRLIAITDGANPLRVLTPQGERMFAPAKVQPVDTTGAGDAFVAGLLFWLMRERIDATRLDSGLGEADMERAIAFASRCGGQACLTPGAFAAMPTLLQVEPLH